MPNDPLSPLTPSQPFPTDAVTWNPVLELARERRQPSRPNVPAVGQSGATCIESLALNDTGAALPRYHPAAVVGTGGFDLTDDRPCSEWSKRTVVTLGVPTGSGDIIAVALEDIPDGQFGKVAVAGWCACLVDVDDDAHQYASPGTTTDALASGSTGSIRFINTGTGDGRRCAVYLGDQTEGGSGLTTRNVDAPDETGSTTDLRFKNGSGLKKTKDSPSAGIDTLEMLEATATQWGAVTTGGQVWSGVKRTTNAFQATDLVTSYTCVGTLGANLVGTQQNSPVGALTTYAYAAFHYTQVYDDAGIGWHVTNANTYTEAKDGTYAYGTYLGSMTLYAAGGFLDLKHCGLSFLNGFRCRDTLYGGYHLDFYVDVNEATNDASAFAPVWTYPVRHAPHLIADGSHVGRRSGVDYIGADAILSFPVSPTDTLNVRFVAGHYIDSWTTTTGSPPAPPPPAPPAPPAPPPPGAGTGKLVGLAEDGGGSPLAGRTVVLSGATSATATTDGSGHYSFGSIPVGSITATLSTPGGETCVWDTGGGTGSGFACTYAQAGGEPHKVHYTVTALPPPPPAPPTPPMTPIPPVPVPPAPPVPPP